MDVLAGPGVNVVDDVATLNGIPDGFATEIYACHVLEHFATDEIPGILGVWLRKLQPGGQIRISVPDLDQIVSIYSRNMPHFLTKGHSPWVGLIYGGQSSPYDFHKTGFNFTWMNLLLENAGFMNIDRYPVTPHFIPGIVDASLAYEPFKEYISLNVTAFRPVSLIN